MSSTADLTSSTRVLGHSWPHGRRALPRSVTLGAAGALLASAQLAITLGLQWLRDGAALGDGSAVLVGWLAGASMLVIAGAWVGHTIDRLEALAGTDALTGLANRRSFRSTLDSEVARASRYRMPLSVILIDLDRLKVINDRGGHAAGDEALARVGRCVRECLRATDTGARFGGDELAVVVPHTRVDEAAVLAERIRCAVRHSGDAPRLTVSVGVADLAGQTHLDARELLGRADDALYRAKSGGRDRVVTAYPSTVPAPVDTTDEESAAAPS